MPDYFQNYGFQNHSNVLPYQQVIQVNGKASVDSIQMTPNSSVLLLDNSAPIVWLCVSDGVGRVTSTPYDIKVHEEIKPPSEIEVRLDRLEQMIKEIAHNEQSNVKQSQSQQSNGKSQSGKNNVQQN
jgi:hypothetical protein